MPGGGGAPGSWAWREAAERREAKRGMREGFMGVVVGLGGLARVIGVTMGGASTFRALGPVFAYWGMKKPPGSEFPEAEEK
jgi:hypothetical protein